MFKFRKILTVILILVVLTSMIIPAWASEPTINLPALAGDTVVYCDVEIQVEDLTGEYPEAELQVNFMDVTNTVNETVTITETEHWGAGVPLVISLPAPTTYYITFVNLAEGYKVVEPETKDSIVTFVATPGNHALSWSIESLVAEEEVVVGIPSSILDYLPTENRDLLVIQNKEAEDLYLAFLEAVSFIETDDTWYGNEELRATATLLGQYDKDFVNGKTFAENYEKYVAGGSVEQYNAMPAFEQFLWTECYTRLAGGVNHNRGWEGVFGSKANYEKMITRPATIMMNGNNAEVVKEAYMKLAEWQYDYVQEHGYPFNFITNRSYIEELTGEPVKLKVPAETLVPPESEKETVGKQDSDEDKTVATRPVEPSAQPSNPPSGKEDVSTEAEARGIWSDTLDALADNMLTLLVLIVLAGALGLIIYIRKRKNIDSNNQGGNFLS